MIGVLIEPQKYPPNIQFNISAVTINIEKYSPPWTYSCKGPKYQLLSKLDPQLYAHHDRLQFFHPQNVFVTFRHLTPFFGRLRRTQIFPFRDPFSVDAIQTSDLPPAVTTHNGLQIFGAEPVYENICRPVGCR